MRTDLLLLRPDHADCCVELGLQMTVAIDMVKQMYPKANLAMRIGKTKTECIFQYCKNKICASV